MPPRRRSTSLRRPRVAGLTSSRPESPTTGTGSTETDVASPEEVAAAETADAPEPTAAHPGPPAADAPAAAQEEPPAGRPLVPLVIALAVAVVLAVLFATADLTVRNTPSASNTALADVGATAAVAGQLGDALERVYSYDFTRLDENERAARAVITPSFQADFDALFEQVRALAPSQQAVVSATVTVSAVKAIEGDRAELVAFLDQRATRAADAQQLEAAGRLTVVGERVDGVWKIAEVRPN